MVNKIIVKKCKSNEYLLTEDRIWVRDFTNPDSPYFDINNLVDTSEYQGLVANEIQNWKRKYPEIGGEIVKAPNIMIVSDGFNFSEKQKIISTLPADICVIGTNKALAEWHMIGKSKIKRMMNFFVVNNPSQDSMIFLPKKTNYYPKCIASVRTNPAFLRNYRGNISSYGPVPDGHYYGPNRHVEYLIDDYRNPICAAIGLAFRFRVQKLLLLCCDDSFEQERPGAEQLENGLWCYPQQKISDRLIDANFHWLKNSGVECANHSSGLKLNNAEYIQEEGIAEFFSR